MGRLGGALDAHAEEFFAQLKPEEQTLCHQLLLDLVHPGEGAADTKKRVAMDDVAPTEPARVLLKKLADARLVTTTGEPEVAQAELAHEALISGWRRLGNWVNENREKSRLKERLLDSAREWQDNGKGGDFLYRGTQLAIAEEGFGSSAQSLPKLAREFLEASVAERNRELEERQIQQQRELEMAQKLARTEAERAQLAENRAREQETARLRELESTNKLRRRAVAVTIAAIAALILLIIAVVWWSTAQEQQRIATVQLGNVDWLLGARARDDNKDVLQSGLFFLKAAKEFQSVNETTLAKSATLAGTLGNRALVCTFLHGGGVLGAVFNRDESRILTWSEDGTARLWVVGQTEPIQTFKHGGRSLARCLTARRAGF